MAELMRGRPIVYIGWNDPTEIVVDGGQNIFLSAEEIIRRGGTPLDELSSEAWGREKYWIEPYRVSGDTDAEPIYKYDAGVPGTWLCRPLRAMLLTGLIKEVNNTLTSTYLLPTGFINRDGGITGSGGNYAWQPMNYPSEIELTEGPWFESGGKNRPSTATSVVSMGKTNTNSTALSGGSYYQCKSAFTGGAIWQPGECFAFRVYNYGIPPGWDTETWPQRFVITLPGPVAMDPRFCIDLLSGNTVNLWKKVTNYNLRTDPPTVIGSSWVIVKSANLPPSQWELKTGEKQICVYWVEQKNTEPNRGQSSPPLYATLVICSDPYYSQDSPDTEMLVYTDPALETHITGNGEFRCYGVGGAYYYTYHPIEFADRVSVLAPWSEFGYEPTDANKAQCTGFFTNPEGENGSTGGTNITFRDPRAYPDGYDDPDTGQTYSYSKTEGGTYNWRWEMLLEPNSTKRKTPAFWGVEIAVSQLKMGAYDGGTLPALSGSDLVSIGGTDMVTAGSSVSLNVTLYNRDGKWNAYDGAHAIKLDVGWELSDGSALWGPEIHGSKHYYRRATGFLWNPVFSRDSNGQGVVTLEFVGHDQIVNDEICIGTPMYDGWCSLYAIYDLLKRVGFSDDQILLYQDPRNSGDKARFVDITNFTSLAGCRGGRCDHYILEYGAWQGEPVYMFEDGTAIAEAVKKIAEAEGAWFFFNNYGNFIYLTPVAIYSQFPSTDARTISQAPYGQLQKTFREVPSFSYSDEDAYNEIRRQLQVAQPIDDRRNAVYVQGLDLYDFYRTFGQSPPAPIAAVIKDDLTVATTDRIPWRRWGIKVDNALITAAQVANQANYLYYLSHRKHRTASWSGWLHPDLFSLDRVDVQEQFQAYGSSNIGMTPIGAEVGNTLSFRLVSVSWQIDLETLSSSMEYEGEVIYASDANLWGAFF